MNKKAVIIDDEPLARSIVASYLKAYPIEVVGEGSNGFEGIKLIQATQPDVVFLDIQMPKISGFEMLELIETPPPVIFTTAFDQYALRAFEANAVDYLLKPFSEERFATAIEKWMKQEGSITTEKLNNFPGKSEQEADRIVVKVNGDISIVPAHDIHYLEAFDDYVKIFTAKDYYLKKKTLGYYEETLAPKGFFRIHRSYLINLSELTRIEPFEKNGHVVVLRNGKRLPVGRTVYPVLKEKLGI
jgi:two-component system LytT family response regulator